MRHVTMKGWGPETEADADADAGTEIRNTGIGLKAMNRGACT